MNTKYEIILPKYYGEPLGGASNCFVNVHAHAAGYYKYFNYYTFHYLYSLFSTWYNKEYAEQGGMKFLLNKMNIGSRDVSIGSYASFVDQVRYNLSNNHPVIITLPDYTTTFNGGFHDENSRDANHSYLIFALKPEQNLIGLKFHDVDTDLLKILKKVPLAGATCTIDQVYQAYTDGQKYLAHQGKSNSDHLLFLQGDFGSNSMNDSSFYSELLNFVKLFEQVDLSRNTLAHILQKDDFSVSENYMRIVMTYHSLQAFKNILLPLTEAMGMIDINWRLDHLLSEYESKRIMILNKISKLSLSKHSSLSDAKNEALELFRYYDHILGECIQEIIIGSQGFDFEQYNKNFALHAKVTVDSESVSDLNGEIYGAERLVDGRWTNGDKDAWYSGGETQSHWAIIEMSKCHAINKIVVHHMAFFDGFITKKFSLYCSMDGVVWTLVDSVEDNSLKETVHLFEKTECRYIKILIEDPGMIDNHARIMEIEASGPSI